MERDDDIVVLEMYSNPVDANIVKGMLEANGVIAGVMGDSTANALMQGFRQGAIRVVVFRKDLERARELMATQVIEDDIETDED